MPDPALHPHSPADDDTLLRGTDGISVKMHSYQLQTHNAVFREMLQIKCDRVDIDIPDLVSDDLLVLRQFLDNETPTVGDIGTPLLEMCRKYEMPGIARAVLRAIPPPQTYDEGFAASKLRLDRMSCIKWAARLDCCDAAIRLYASFEVDADVKHNMPGVEGFDGTAAKDFSPAWILALDRARTDVKDFRESCGGAICDMHFWQRYTIALSARFAMRE